MSVMCEVGLPGILEGSAGCTLGSLLEALNTYVPEAKAVFSASCLPLSAPTAGWGGRDCESLEAAPGPGSSLAEHLLGEAKPPLRLERQLAVGCVAKSLVWPATSGRGWLIHLSEPRRPHL